MNPNTIIREVTGVTAVIEAKEIIEAAERLGFSIQEISASGGWHINGEYIVIAGHSISTPRRKIELAPGVFASPTEASAIVITAQREED